MELQSYAQLRKDRKVFAIVLSHTKDTCPATSESGRMQTPQDSRSHYCVNMIAMERPNEAFRQCTFPSFRVSRLYLRELLGYE